MNVDQQTKGIEFLKDKRIGLNPEQKGDVRVLIKKWLRASEKGVSHVQNLERGPRNLERIKKFFHSQFVPTLETFPKEEYIRVQNEAALAQGRGRITNQITTDQINQGIAIEIENIKESLDPWIEYFTSPDSSSFPIWAKYWAFIGVTKMSGKTKQNEEGEITFSKRENNTISRFPELNREALSKAVDHIQNLVEKGNKLDETLTKENFRDVYTHCLNKLRGDKDQSELQITEGTWVKYSQGDNPKTVDDLVESLDGKFTNWCTAGRSTAQEQLKSGDFYVYYSKSKSDKANPRIAIRMDGSNIAEVRGIGAQQNLDEVISGTEILDQKLSEFGEKGKQYKKRSENMSRLSEIYNSLRKDREYQLKKEDLLWLKSSPEGFGYEEDPRIKEVLSFSALKEKYNIKVIDETAINAVIKGNDYEQMIVCIGFIDPRMHPILANKLFEAGRGEAVAENLGKFSGLNLNAETANKLIEAGEGQAVAIYLEKFSGLNHIEIANKLFEAGRGRVVANNLEKFSGLNHIEIANKLIEDGEGGAVGYNLDKFSGLNAEIANKIIEAGVGEFVGFNLDKFSGLNHTEIANKLIDAFNSSFFLMNLDKFSGLNADIANKLIRDGAVNAVAENLEKFSGLNHIEIANLLISLRRGGVVVKNLEKFSGLNADIASKLLNNGLIDVQTLRRNRDSFINIDELIK